MNRLQKGLIGASGVLALLIVGPMVHAQAAAAKAAVAGKSAKPAPTGAPASAEENADALFARWDTNHDKSLSPVEFRTGWEGLQAAAAMQRLHAQFVLLDVDKNGCMNAAEYSHMALVQRAGKSAPPMSKFDEQRNQCLDFKEYVNVVKALAGSEKK